MAISNKYVDPLRILHHFLIFNRLRKRDVYSVMKYKHLLNLWIESRICTNLSIWRFSQSWIMIFASNFKFNLVTPTIFFGAMHSIVWSSVLSSVPVDTRIIMHAVLH